MPAAAEKPPRWLMRCKCGATVKPAGGRNRIWWAGCLPPCGVRNQARPTDRALISGASRPRSDGGKLRDIWRRYRRLAAALEQHPPLEIAGAETGIAFEDFLAYRQIIGRHQTQRFGQGRIRTRRAESLLQENATIKSLMVLAHGRRDDVSMHR